MKGIKWAVLFCWAALTWVMVACQEREIAPAVCDFSQQSPLRVLLSDENGQPLRQVQVRYQVNDAPWESLPERVSGEVRMGSGPGDYQILAQKRGYATVETAVSIPTPTENCQLATQTVQITMMPLVCPDPSLAHMHIRFTSVASAQEIVAKNGSGQPVPLACTRRTADGCAEYLMSLTAPDELTLTIDGLPGFGAPRLNDGIIRYDPPQLDMALSQSTGTHALSVIAAERATITIPTTLDEIGCAQAEFVALSLTQTPESAVGMRLPALAVAQENSLLITNLGADACQQAQTPIAVRYAATVPDGTSLQDVQVQVYLDGGWQQAACAWEETGLVCTAIMPSPLVGAFYAFKISDGHQEQIGTSLPIEQVCLVFGP